MNEIAAAVVFYY